MCPDFVIFQDDIPSKKPSSKATKFEVAITSTVTNYYLVEADDWEEAEDIAMFGEANGDVIPCVGTKHAEDIVNVEEIDESP